MTRIKICGLSRPQDVACVNQAKPDWCGFVVNFPKSRRSVTPDQLRSLRRELDPSVVPVGEFVDQPVEVVTDLLNRGIISIAQLHGGEDEDYTAALRAAAPGKEIWKAFQVHEPADLERAIAFPADRILLDSGQGTGRTFDWSLLRHFPRTFDWSLLRHFPRPYLLAGGLDPENLPEAIRTLRPYGVDLSSGVETDGLKDFTKIQAAVAAAREE